MFLPLFITVTQAAMSILVPVSLCVVRVRDVPFPGEEIEGPSA